jgi:hypothetical protein
VRVVVVVDAAAGPDRPAALLSNGEGSTLLSAVGGGVAAGAVVLVRSGWRDGVAAQAPDAGDVRSYDGLAEGLSALADALEHDREPRLVLHGDIVGQLGVVDDVRLSPRRETVLAVGGGGAGPGGGVGGGGRGGRPAGRRGGGPRPPGV